MCRSRRHGATTLLRFVLRSRAKLPMTEPEPKRQQEKAETDLTDEELEKVAYSVIFTNPSSLSSVSLAMASVLTLTPGSKSAFPHL